VKPNPGHCPEEAEGKRVRVRLADGSIAADLPGAPPGWAADGRNGCNWQRRGFPFDIAEYEVIS
jgi:hypothetical protein